jgi:hypothetical protein
MSYDGLAFLYSQKPYIITRVQSSRTYTQTIKHNIDIDKTKCTIYVTETVV